MSFARTDRQKALQLEEGRKEKKKEKGGGKKKKRAEPRPSCSRRAAHIDFVLSMSGLQRASTTATGVSTTARRAL